MFELRVQRFGNLARTGLIVLGLAATLLGVGWILGGGAGAALALAFVAGVAIFGPRPSAQRLMAAQGNRPLHPAEVPDLHEAVHTLSRRAGLAQAPHLYLLPSRSPQALTTDGPDGAVIGLTPGLVRLLGPRQLLAVVAHELAHLQNRDLTLLRLAEITHSVTASAAQMSFFLVVLAPLLWLFGAPIPWAALGLLIVTPWLVRLLVAALSRAREHDADATAAALTGDPIALASALERIERHQRPPWWAWWLPIEGPGALRSHPPTEERVARLLELARA